MAVFTDIKKEDVEKLKGWTNEEPKTAYEELRLTKNGVSLILYTSGKLLLQGNPVGVEKVAAEIEKLHPGKMIKPQKFRKESGNIIGSDEALKGDTFGGLTVAAVKADNIIREKLLELGVADSKNLSDKEVLAMAGKIKRLAPCEIISLLPEEYNSHRGNEAGKVTDLLNKYHRATAKALSPGKHIVDKYPGCHVGDVQEEKAESKYIEVAAASVLARAAGLQQLNYLSSRAGFAVPKGSSHVKLGLHELKERNLDPRMFVKLNFGNVSEFL